MAAYVPAVISGNHVYTSGQLPFINGKLEATGKVFPARDRALDVQQTLLRMLKRAGAKRASLLDASAADVETSFEVNELDFLAAPDRPRKGTLPPWATADRARHPKRYLQFLCDPTGKEARAYVETAGGRAALRELDWPAVLAPPEHVRFMRSLIHDLADALGEDAVAQRYAGATHPLTWPPQRNGLLRNI